MQCKTITVASQTGCNTIAGPVTVTVPIDHQNIGHLTIKLFTPTDSFTLVSRPGTTEAADDGTGTGDNDTSNLVLASPITFSMAATPEAETMGNTIGITQAVCANDGICSFDPDNGASTLSEDLSILNGDVKNGTWSLCVADSVTGDGGAPAPYTGTLGDWTLNLGASPAADTCASSGLARTFTVSDSFSTTGAAVGLNITHAERGDVRAFLIAPDSTEYALFGSSADTSDNYDVLVSGNSDAGEDGTAPVNDGDVDLIAAPIYNRLVTAPALSSVTEAASGTWTLRVCDSDTDGNTGTLNQARLVLLRSATAASTVCTSRITYDWGANGNGVDFTSVTVNGVTLTETATTNYSSGLDSGTYWNFRTDTDSMGGHTGFYSLYMDAQATGGTQDSENMGQRAAFGFSVGANSVPVYDLEFSTLDSDQADGDFEDILRVEGVAQGGGFTSFSRTPASGSPVFQDAGDTIEADSACDNAQNCATEAYAFAGAVTGMSFYYFAGDDIPSEPGDQVVGLTDFQFCAFDYGDAPTSYNTALANGPKHALSSRNIYLGDLPPDGESDGQSSAAATATTTPRSASTTTRTATTTSASRLRRRHLRGEHDGQQHVGLRPGTSSATSIGTATATSLTPTSGRRPVRAERQQPTAPQR